MASKTLALTVTVTSDWNTLTMSSLDKHIVSDKQRSVVSLARLSESVGLAPWSSEQLDYCNVAVQKIIPNASAP